MGIRATWIISLDCTCPGCNEFVDLLDLEDFWEDHPGLHPPEHSTKRTNDMPVICPECGWEFDVCCEY